MNPMILVNYNPQTSDLSLKEITNLITKSGSIDNLPFDKIDPEQINQCLKFKKLFEDCFPDNSFNP